MDKKQILNQIIAREVDNASNENRKINQCLDIIIEYAEKLKSSKDKVAPNHWYILSQLCCSKEKLIEAEKYYDKGVLLSQKIIEAESNEDLKKKIKEIYTIASLNFSCQLLKHGKNEAWLAIVRSWAEYTSRGSSKNGKEHYSSHSAQRK